MRGRRDAADRVDEPVDVLGLDHPAVLAAAHEVGGLPDARRHERHARRHRLEHRARPAFVSRGDEAHVDRRVHLRDIVDVQATHGILSWNVFGGFQIVAFFIYLIAAYAETNRAPFDLVEAESELTGGYHTEYSSMKFAMFFMAEYANMITVGCVATLLFFGGWTSPFGNLLPTPHNIVIQALLPIFWFVIKVFFFVFLYIWVRGTTPRFRYDQLMGFGWKFLVPLAIANIIVAALIYAPR